jgi:hypothetical protein
MAFGSSVKVEKNDLPKLSSVASLEIVDAAAREIAFEVLRASWVYLDRLVYTRPNIQVTSEKMDKVPEPTGGLRNSGYVRSFTGELPLGCPNETEAMSSSKSKNPDITYGQAPPGPARLGQAQVLFAAEYGLYVEMGTILGMIARPYLAPAVNGMQDVAEKFVMAKLKEAGFA